MAAVDLAEFVVPVEPKRDRYGRYLIVPPDGGKAKPYTRVTTFAETLDDRYNLEAWKQRMVALGIAARPDLYAQIASCRPDDKAALNQLCDKAREAANASSGANLGSALHRFTERIDIGEDITVPAPWNADIDAWQTAIATARFAVVPGMVERIVVVDQLEVAGTFDRMLQRDGKTFIGDLKTGSTLDFSWGAISVQLACYAHATTIYDPATEQHQPMPAVDQQHAVVIHLPVGQHTCTLYWVDIEAGWEAAQHARWVRTWRKNKKLSKPIVEIEAPPPVAPVEDLTERRTWIVDRIRWLATNVPAAAQKIAANWPDVPTFKTGHAHTRDELDLIATVLHQAEAEFDLPFDADAEPGVAIIDRHTKARLARQVEKLPGPFQIQLGEWCAANNLTLTQLRERDLSAVEAKLTELAVFAAL